MVRSLRAVRWKLGQHLWPMRVNRLCYLGRRFTHRWHRVDQRVSPVAGVVTIWDLGRERRMVFGEDVSAVTQSAIFTRGSWSQLRREYWGQALLLPATIPERPRVLVLGLGGGTMVRMVHQMTRPAVVTVVERDPVVVETAQDHMGLGELPDLDVRIGDVRDVLPVLADEAPYDLVIEDVYYGGVPADDYDDPADFVDLLRAVVSPNGWLVLNRWFKEWNGAPVDSGQELLLPVLAERFRAVDRKQITQRWFNELIAAGMPRP
jgi:spermidine synthase